MQGLTEKHTEPVEQIQSPITTNFLNRKLLRSREVISGSTTYIENDYDIPGYGPCTFVKIAGRSEQEYRQTRSGIPIDFIGKKLKDFDWGRYDTDTTPQRKIAEAFVNQYDLFLTEPRGLYIYSNTRGSGKSYLVSCCMNSLVDNRGINPKFITAADLMELSKKSFKDETAAEEFNHLFNVSLLTIDDLGTEMGKDWDTNVLYRIINHRISKRLITMYTSNSSVDKLKLDARIIDRIFSSTTQIIMPEVSIRNQLAQEKNRAFLKQILN